MVLVSGPGRIVLVDNDGLSAANLAAYLSDGDMEIQVQSASNLPQDLAPLLGIDALVLINVDNSVLTYAQQEMLQRYVTDLGGGLIMIGGPESFGAGGWIGSPRGRDSPRWNSTLPTKSRCPRAPWCWSWIEAAP